MIFKIFVFVEFLFFEAPKLRSLSIIPENDVGVKNKEAARIFLNLRNLTTN